MANEITLNASLKLVNGSLGYDRKLVNKTINQSAGRLSSVVQTTTTTAAQLVVGASVSTLGYAWLRNLDATNYVQIGLYISSTFYPFMRLKPGEAGIARLEPGISVYAKSNTANVDLEFAVLND